MCLFSDALDALAASLVQAVKRKKKKKDDDDEEEDEKGAEDIDLQTWPGSHVCFSTSGSVVLQGELRVCG